MASRWTKRRKIDAEVQNLLNEIADCDGEESKSSCGSQVADTLAPLCYSVKANDCTEHTGSSSFDFTSESACDNGIDGEAEFQSVLQPGLENEQFNENISGAEIEQVQAVVDEFSDLHLYWGAAGYEYSTSEFEDSTSESAVSDANDYVKSAETCHSTMGIEDNNVQNELSLWAVEHNITHAALSSLLIILRKRFKSLPKDPRTLLKTVRTIQTEDIAGGEYCHLGIEEGIKKIMSNGICNRGVPVEIQINVDGLPLFKSSSTQLWPILGRIQNDRDLLVSNVKNQPFVIGVYQGKHKPTNAADFLSEFVLDAQRLETVGIQHLNDCVHAFKIAAFICDMPARSFVKCVKGHGAYSGCDRCIQVGVYQNKVTYPDCAAALRTDETFRNMTDKNHHLQTSPLIGLHFGLVSNFPLDYMHLVCLGVVRKLVCLWLAGPLKVRLSPLVRKETSEKLRSFAAYTPSEFARKPRPITEFERWKATEYRSFLLYTGPVCLLDSLPEELYNNFMILSLAVSLMLSPALCRQYADYCHDLLVMFVGHFATLYGEDKITYNVHGLVHLPDDVKLYGALDNISAFPFENFLGSLKHYVRKQHLPLQQIIRRLSEVSHVQASECSAKPEQLLIYKQLHFNGPLVNGLDADKQFREMHIKGFKIKLGAGDKYVRIDSKDVISVENIVADRNQDIWLIYRKFHDCSNFFTYPLPSADIGIFKFGRLGKTLHHCLASCVTAKYFILPYKTTYIGFPLLHSLHQ